MGMMLYDALVLARCAQLIDRRESVLSLGVPTLNFSAADFGRYVPNGTCAATEGLTSQADFFGALRFSSINALDISDYEGANFVGDLNDPQLVGSINRQFDLVYDSGTIEHIFDIATALRTVSKLVRTGGIVVHATPANGFLDHGFWQVSPDLFRTFYSAAGFSILTSALVVLGDQSKAIPADENLYRKHGRRWVAQQFPEAIVVFAAQKQVESGSDQISMQDYYKAKHVGPTDSYENAFFIDFTFPPPPNWRGKIVNAAQRLGARVLRGG